jgi:hypothetical protein
MNRFKILVTTSLAFLAPLSTFAQNRGEVIANDQVAYATIFTGDFSMLLSIVIGVIATSLVLRAARRMGGGLFGSVLNYIGVGMALIVLGTISVVFDTWGSGVWFSVINTVCFATGYIFIVIGANKLLKGIINT